MTGARSDVAAIASRLMAAHDNATMLAPISAGDPEFDVSLGYDVLREIEARRVASGWQPVGRKIGFTNRTIWPRYGVYLPMWAHVWTHTVQYAPEHRATLSLAAFVQPRIEPEVVFGLKGRVPENGDAAAVLASTEWIAPGFEIVQSHFPDWKFAAADCTAAFGLHAALVVGAPIPVTERNRAFLADTLPRFTLTLRRSGELIDEGVGATAALTVGLLRWLKLGFTYTYTQRFDSGTSGTTTTTQGSFNSNAGYSENRARISLDMNF